MPTLVITNFNIVCAVLGGFITLFGLGIIPVERAILSFRSRYAVRSSFLNLLHADITTVISMLTGVAFGPHAADFIRPGVYAMHDEHNLEVITLYFSRLVLGIQLVLAGVQLPK